jgi:WD40 repeat protein
MRAIPASLGFCRSHDDAKTAKGANPLIQTLPGDKGMNLNLAFSKDGQFLALGGSRKLTVWDTTTWTESLRRPASAAIARAGGTAVAFSPDSRCLAAGAGQVGTDFPIKTLDAASSREIHILRGHAWVVTAVVFSPDPDVPLLASASLDSTVRIWDMTAGKQIVAPLHHSDAVWSVRYRHGYLQWWGYP